MVLNTVVSCSAMLLPCHLPHCVCVQCGGMWCGRSSHTICVCLCWHENMCVVCVKRQGGGMMMTSSSLPNLPSLLPYLPRAFPSLDNISGKEKEEKGILYICCKHASVREGHAHAVFALDAAAACTAPAAVPIKRKPCRSSRRHLETASAKRKEKCEKASKISVETDE